MCHLEEYQIFHMSIIYGTKASVCYSVKEDHASMLIIPTLLGTVFRGNWKGACHQTINSTPL